MSFYSKTFLVVIATILAIIVSLAMLSYANNTSNKNHNTSTGDLSANSSDNITDKSEKSSEPTDLSADFPPIGPLPPVTANPDNMPTPERILLGQTIFFDNRISKSGTINCASCHIPNRGWTVNTAISPAHPGAVERRNSPTLLNVGYVKRFIWDGRAPSLEKQAIGSTKNPVHKAQDIDYLMEVYNNDPKIVELFAKAYNSKPNIPDYGKAIAVFQRHVIITKDSKFDLYMKGDKTALNASELRGLDIFKGKGQCITCHNGPNFTDSEFYNVGLEHNSLLDKEVYQKILKFDAKRTGLEEWESITTDPGRYLISHDKADWGKFKTPTLRNLKDTYPYMHDGRYETLDQVIAHYNNGGDENAVNKDPRIQPLHLTATEQADLKAFLLALYGEPPEIAVKDIITQAKAPTLDGKSLFEGKGTCINCHQANGQGIPGAFPPLAGNPHVTAGDGSYVAKTILHGRTGTLEVNGQTFNATMPNIGMLYNLNDAEVAAIATYVRNTWGNKGSTVTKEMVAKVR